MEKRVSILMVLLRIKYPIKKPTTRYLFSLRVLSIIGNKFVWNISGFLKL